MYEWKNWHFSIIIILLAFLFLAIRLLDKIYFGKYAPMWTAESSLFITKDGKKEKVSKYFSWESKNCLRPHSRISSFIYDQRFSDMRLRWTILKQLEIAQCSLGNTPGGRADLIQFFFHYWKICTYVKTSVRIFFGWWSLSNIRTNIQALGF